MSIKAASARAALTFFGGLIVLGSIAVLPATVTAAELIMVESRGCGWCILWNREIAPAYPHTAAGLRAPLRRVDIKDVATLGLALTAPVKSTPTFLLVENGAEVGRMTGYPGDMFFWSLLDEMIARLEPLPSCSGPACPRTTTFKSFSHEIVHGGGS